MTIYLNAGRVRQGWQHGTSAHAELGDARTQVTSAAGSNLEELQATLTDAAADMDGVLEVAQAALDAFGSSLEECITTYDLTDGRSDGSFDELHG